MIRFAGGPIRFSLGVSATRSASVGVPPLHEAGTGLTTAISGLRQRGYGVGVALSSVRFVRLVGVMRRVSSGWTRRKDLPMESGLALISTSQTPRDWMAARSSLRPPLGAAGFQWIERSCTK